MTVDDAVNRSILIFPSFANIDVIDKIRDRYDPAAKLVRPHITLVFPFKSVISAEDLAGHMEKTLAGVRPFSVSCHGISALKGFGNYLLLNVHTGRIILKELHRKLYTGMLENYKPQWLRSYEPHITVGKIGGDGSFAMAAEAVAGVDEVFETCVNEISLETIGLDGSSAIEYTLKLPAF